MSAGAMDRYLDAVRAYAWAITVAAAAERAQDAARERVDATREALTGAQLAEASRILSKEGSGPASALARHFEDAAILLGLVVGALGKEDE